MLHSIHFFVIFVNMIKSLTSKSYTTLSSNHVRNSSTLGYLFYLMVLCSDFERSDFFSWKKSGVSFAYMVVFVRASCSHKQPLQNRIQGKLKRIGFMPVLFNLLCEHERKHFAFGGFCIFEKLIMVRITM